MANYVIIEQMDGDDPKAYGPFTDRDKVHRASEDAEDATGEDYYILSLLPGEQLPTVERQVTNDAS